MNRYTVKIIVTIPALSKEDAMELVKQEIDNVPQNNWEIEKIKVIDESLPF